MKKILAICLMLALVAVMLCACAEDADDFVFVDKSNENNVEDPTSDTPPAGDDTPSGGGDDTPSGGGDDTPSGGGEDTPSGGGGDTPSGGGNEDEPWVDPYYNEGFGSEIPLP